VKLKLSRKVKLRKRRKRRKRRERGTGEGSKRRKSIFCQYRLFAYFKDTNPTNNERFCQLVFTYCKVSLHEAGISIYSFTRR
jgi:hypothetical protein